MKQEGAPNNQLSLVLAIVATIVWAIAFFPGLLAGIMQVAAPGGTSPSAWPMVTLALSFPLLCVVSIIGAWACFIVERSTKRSKPSFALVVFVALPVLPIAIGVLIIFIGLAGMLVQGKSLGMTETFFTTPPSELEWTKPKNGLALGAPAFTTGYHGGTTAPVTVAIRNVGTTDVTCAKIQSNDIVVVGRNGTMHGETSPSPPFPSEGDATTLQPSGEVAQTIDLAGAVFPPGQYHVTITWRCRDDMSRDILPAPQAKVLLTVP